MSLPFGGLQAAAPLRVHRANIIPTTGARRLPSSSRLSPRSALRRDDANEGRQGFFLFSTPSVVPFSDFQEDMTEMNLEGEILKGVDDGGPNAGKPLGGLSLYTEGKSEALPDTVLCLRDTPLIGLNAKPQSPSGEALVRALMQAVEAHEKSAGTRKSKRRESGAGKLHRAAAAFAGGLMLNAAETGEPLAWSFHPARDDEFPGTHVTKNAFDAVKVAMKALGLVAEKPPYTRFLGTDGLKERFAARHRLTPALWSLAASHGVAGLGDVAQHFHREGPIRAPKVLKLRKLSPENAREGTRGAPLPVPKGPEAVAIRDEVVWFNAKLAGVPIEGCDPFTLFRSFTEDFAHGGRLYATGKSYQQMKGDVGRAALRINGTAVREADVSASFLTILHGVLGLPLPTDGDLYEAVSGYSRDTVKAWLTCTVGAGTPCQSWSRAAKARGKKYSYSLAGVDAKAVGEAVLARYPFIANLPALLGCEHEPRLAGLKLQRIEAQALTYAMWSLWDDGIPSLPMHDSLIVPEQHESAAVLALKEAYSREAKIVPRVKVK